MQIYDGKIDVGNKIASVSIQRPLIGIVGQNMDLIVGGSYMVFISWGLFGTINDASYI